MGLRQGRSGLGIRERFFTDRVGSVKPTGVGCSGQWSGPQAA